MFGTCGGQGEDTTLQTLIQETEELYSFIYVDKIKL